MYLVNNICNKLHGNIFLTYSYRYDQQIYSHVSPRLIFFTIRLYLFVQLINFLVINYIPDYDGASICVTFVSYNSFSNLGKIVRRNLAVPKFSLDNAKKIVAKNKDFKCYSMNAIRYERSK